MTPFHGHLKVQPQGVLVVLGALVIVSLGLKPLQQLQQAVGRISAKTLADRLVTQTLPSELQSLGTAFNAMLDRLDNIVTRLSEFSGDLAHEMRTPLATLLGRTQVALSQPRSNEQGKLRRGQCTARPTYRACSHTDWRAQKTRK